MAPEVIRADSGGDLLVWIIIGLFWFIAQVVQKIKSKSRPKAPPASPEAEASAPDMEQQIKEFFETLTGAPVSQAPDAAPFLDGEEARPHRKKRLKRAAATEAPPLPPPAPAPAIRETPAPEMPQMAGLLKKGGVILPRLSAMHLRFQPWPGMTGANLSRAHHGASPVRPALKGRAALARAVVAREILDAPRCLDH